MTEANRILTYCERGLQNEGAELVTGGQRVGEGELAAGNFIAPTVFDRVRQDIGTWRKRKSSDRSWR